MPVIASLLATLALPLALMQEPAAPPAPQAQHDEALRIFLDCQPWICDIDHIRTEITFVNFVRDRTDAQVHVLVTTQETGAGGSEYTLGFIGLGTFTGKADTLVFSSRPTDTQDDIRRGLVRTLKLGLLRYVAVLPAAASIEIRYTPPGGEQQSPGSRQRRDPWNYWVFQVGANTFLQGESQQSSRSVSGNLSANRVTERWKIRSQLNGYDNYSRFELDSVTTYKSYSHSYGANLTVVKSAGPHWSVGGTGGISNSTFDNRDLQVQVGPAIEYDLYPYRESTRRSLRFHYSLGVQFARYHETTIFNKDRETLYQHSLEIALDLTQPWGSAGVSLNGSQYLHDLSKLDAGIFGSVNLRIVRGLNLNVGGNYSLVRDQLSLPAAGATPQEILVRQRQLATNHSYFMSFGLNYTFGSIYNNVVNPRFGSGGRMIMF